MKLVIFPLLLIFAFSAFAQTPAPTPEPTAPPTPEPTPAATPAATETPQQCLIDLPVLPSICVDD